MIMFGNGLQKKYSNVVKSDLSTNAQKQQAQSDREALGKVARARREARLARLAIREQKNPKIALEILEKDPLAQVDVKSIIDNAKSKTNHLARQYGVPEPNNPEALAHDRLSCYACNRKLHEPNAYKKLDDETAKLFDDVEVRQLCCWCFGAMGDEQVKSIRTNKELTKEIRLAIYNPVESTKAEIEAMTELKRIQLKSKIKRHEAETHLVGNVKHDYLLEGDQFENQVIYRAKTRWTACTL